jgi:hypothetical protein
LEAEDCEESHHDEEDEEDEDGDWHALLIKEEESDVDVIVE